MKNQSIPFSPPNITDDDIAAVVSVLKSSWITTGPITKQFEEALATYSQMQNVLCLNSATAALEIALKLFGVKEGDEVIVPAYTYTASASVVLHLGAKPVFIDSLPNSYNLNPALLKNLITTKTKAIMAVDIAGFSADYDFIMQEINNAKHLFTANNDLQKELGRPLLLADAAHSLGAIYKNKKASSYADMSCYSFHAVKNLTTAEGGALCLKDIGMIKADDIYKEAKLWSLHGQNKDALAKQKSGSADYDILMAGYKCNMSDIAAALGLSQLKRYDDDLLVRKKIMHNYRLAFKNHPSITMLDEKEIDKSSAHLCMINIANYDEEKRTVLMQKANLEGINLNIHFKPLPLLTLYKNLGYTLANLENSYNLYKQELSLPVYVTLKEEDQKRIIEFLLNEIQK